VRVTITVACLLGLLTEARGAEGVLPRPAPEEIRAGKPLSTTSEAATPANAAWRYRQHQGQWWYYLGPDCWLLWDGHDWKDVRPTGAVPTAPPQVAVNTGPARRVVSQWRAAAGPHEHHGWVGGFYSSGGGYGSPAFGYGYGIPDYGPWQPAARSRR
jgi:hypothetical protein